MGGLFGGGDSGALQAQVAAMREALEVQKYQMKRNNSLQQQQLNRVNAQTVNAANAIDEVPKVTNPSNLTGGGGVPTSDLNLGSSSLLGNNKDDTLL